MKRITGNGPQHQGNFKPSERRGDTAAFKPNQKETTNPKQGYELRAGKGRFRERRPLQLLLGFAFAKLWLQESEKSCYIIASLLGKHTCSVLLVMTSNAMPMPSPHISVGIGIYERLTVPAQIPLPPAIEFTIQGMAMDRKMIGRPAASRISGRGIEI